MSLTLPADDADSLRRRTATGTQTDSSSCTRAAGFATGKAPGLHRATRTTRLGHGEATFARARQRLLSWQVQVGAGVRVRASSPQVVPDAVAEVRLGVGPASVRAPVRVSWVIDRADCVGFEYVTLQGHPVRGSEWFIVHRDDSGAAFFTVSAVSTPAWALFRIARPVVQTGQAMMMRRYASALQRS